MSPRLDEDDLLMIRNQTARQIECCLASVCVHNMALVTGPCSACIRYAEEMDLIGILYRSMVT